ncbi:helix-turn-helix domain-containing protein [Cohnella zeiphila]|uniref:Helix-turn-helix domain-containing protein n=1 Tax=Cohnella zeiphila TaxID=2761120 RepID=A0A7X0SLF5_9BACL|nr:helix-turn-helix domain-containing protein [Cohnella zeiphila]MBB6732091.1 helix-turn-helix domain-containing protein [Cohnella zeiphila]
MRIIEDLDRRSYSIAVTPAAFARTSLPHAQFVGHYYANPGYSIERDMLDSYLLLYTLNGRGCLRYGNSVSKLEKGTAFLIDCNAYHLYYTDSPAIWEFVYLHFAGNTSEDYANHFMKLGGPAVEVGEGEFRDKIMAIRDLQSHMDERTDLLTARLIVDLLTALLLAAMGREKHEPDYIGRIKRDLEHRLEEGVSLDELAKKHALSKYHLSREFKKHTGYSPYEYLVNLRMKRAKQLLRYSDASVEEITRQVGFSSSTHFIHMFRTREQTTPLQFRKTWQGKAAKDSNIH